MRERPAGLDDDTVAAALLEGWAIRAKSLEYLPLGAGSYHWSVVGHSGVTRFVKVDDAGTRDVLDHLRRSFATAAVLRHQAGLEFVVAPLPALDGAVVRRLGPRHAVSVYPMLDGAAGDFAPHRRADLPELTALLAALHRATPLVAGLAPRATLRLPGRRGLHEALQAVDRPWTDGPYGEPARDLLARHRARIRRWLTDLDRLADTVRQAAPDWVVTHGEPHPGNVVRTGGGLRLIDWTTVQIAPPERDLWMLTPAFAGMVGADAADAGEAPVHYTAATGRAITSAGIELYRQWWVLADIAAFTADLRRPHSDGADAAAALTYLTGYLEAD